MSEPLLDIDTIDGLAELDESAMPDTYTITDVVLSDDGPVSTSTRTVIGRWEHVSGTEAGADQIRAFGAHRLYVPKTTSTILPTATITNSAGKVFNVKYPFPLDNFSTSLKLGLEDA